MDRKVVYAAIGLVAIGLGSSCASNRQVGAITSPDPTATAPTRADDPRHGVQLHVSEEGVQPGQTFRLEIVKSEGYDISWGQECAAELWAGDRWVPRYTVGCGPPGGGENRGMLREADPPGKMYPSGPAYTGSGLQNVTFPKTATPGTYRMSKPFFYFRPGAERAEEFTVTVSIDVVLQ